MSLIVLILIILLLLIIYRIIWLLYVRKTIRNLLVKLICEFEKADVKYWVDFGSLLGMMREKDVILGDNDGDVCILQSDQENTDTVRKIVENMGGKYFEWGAFRVYDGFIFIDIYLVKDDDEFKQNDGNIVKQRVSLGDNDFTASIPKDPHNHLTRRYGSDWQTPVYKWYFLYTKYLT